MFNLVTLFYVLCIYVTQIWLTLHLQISRDAHELGHSRHTADFNELDMACSNICSWWWFRIYILLITLFKLADDILDFIGKWQKENISW